MPRLLLKHRVVLDRELDLFSATWRTANVVLLRARIGHFR